jgi:hypothetical protein
VVQLLFGAAFTNIERRIRQSPLFRFGSIGAASTVPGQVGDLQTAIKQVANGGIIGVAPALILYLVVA